MSFFDHFDTLDTARWGSITSGTGTVGVTDSTLELACPANNDAAAIYLKAPIVTSTPQIIAICLKSDAAVLNQLNQWVLFLDKATAPVADTLANIGTLSRLRWSSVNSNALSFSQWQTGHTRKELDSAGAWGTPTQVAEANGRLDDYHVALFEFDGTRVRVHLQAKGYTTANTWEFDQGFRTFLISDWVTLASMEAISNSLWLEIGHPVNNATNTGTIRVEWVRMADGTVVDLYCNSRDSGAGWVMKHAYSLDGKQFVSEDRTTNHLGLGSGGAWDDQFVKPGSVIKDGSTYYSFYSGSAVATSKQQIGYGTSTATTGAFTKYASNPIIANTSGNKDQVFYPYVIKDEADSDSTKRWKMIYASFNPTGPRWAINYATASAPDGTWTDQGEILTPGGVGDFDQYGCSNPCMVHYGGQWVVFYGANNTGTAAGWSIGRAKGASLTSLTKDGTTALYNAHADASEVITVNINGRTATMASTTGFVQDQALLIDKDTTTDNYTIDRVRKVNTNTSLDLYHNITGFPSATPAKVFGLDAGSVSPSDILSYNNEYYLYVSLFQIAAPTATYDAYHETMGLMRMTTPLDTPAIDWPATPCIPTNDYSGKRSLENGVTIHTPMTAYTSAGVGARSSRIPHIGLRGFRPGRG